MTMTDQPTETTKPKPRRKYTRRKRAAAPPARPPKGPPAELAGLNATTCCNACNPTDGCFISHGSSCVHPNKGGLQAAHLMNYEIVRRFELAKDYLAQAKQDKVKI